MENRKIAICFVIMIAASALSAAEPRIIVYSAPWCGFCVRLEQYLTERNIKFQKIDTDKNIGAKQAAKRKSGQAGIPVLDWGGEIIVGFGENEKKEVDRLINGGTPIQGKLVPPQISRQKDKLKNLKAGKNDLTVVLFKEYCVTLRYAFQAEDSLSLTGNSVLQGRIKLYPQEGGSYRPPARAFFSLKQNRRVESGGVLDICIEVDQQDGQLYFSGSRGRFDHCTDMGLIDFDKLAVVDTDKLERKREDTLIKQGHVYFYESNIYEPSSRTRFTGFDVRYAKILVESIELADISTDIRFTPATPIAGKALTIYYRPSSEDLDGARNISLLWAGYNELGEFVTGKDMIQKELLEFPSEPRGTGKGDFELARKKCFIQSLTPEPNGYWLCDVNLPDSAKTLAILFIDDLGRTAKDGIQKYDVKSYRLNKNKEVGKENE